MIITFHFEIWVSLPTSYWWYVWSWLNSFYWKISHQSHRFASVVGKKLVYVWESHVDRCRDVYIPSLWGYMTSLDDSFFWFIIVHLIMYSVSGILLVPFFAGWIIYRIQRSRVTLLGQQIEPQLGDEDDLEVGWELQHQLRVGVERWPWI